MSGAKIAATVVIGVALVAALIGLFTPWWTWTAHDGDESEEINEIKPFDSGEELGDADPLDTQALLAGLLMIGAVVALAAGAVLVGLSFMPGKYVLGKVGSGAALAGGLLVVAAVLLAVFLWPGPVEDEAQKAVDEGEDEAEPFTDVAFWDTITEEGGSCDDPGCVKLAASFGWYLAAAAALVGVAGGIVGFTAKSTARAAQPGMAQGGWGATPAGAGWGGAPQEGSPWAGQAQPSPPPPPNPWAPPPASAPVATTGSGWPQQQVVQQPRPTAPPTVVKCPQCQTRVQAPPIRPLDLVCPNCGFTARLT